jgi:Tim44-like domain
MLADISASSSKLSLNSVSLTVSPRFVRHVSFIFPRLFLSNNNSQLHFGHRNSLCSSFLNHNSRYFHSTRNLLDSKINHEADAKNDSSSSSQATSPIKKPNKFLEDLKDIISVTFGIERKRDLTAEYESGARPYPWITYVDPISEKRLYANRDSGVITEIKPLDFDRFAKEDANVNINIDANAIAAIKQTTEESRWNRTLAAVSKSPIISSILEVGKVIAESPVGQAAGNLNRKVKEKVEDAREVWETSQHPLIVNAGYVVDNVVAETEQGKAIKEILQIDSGFDQYAFVEEMRESLLPMLAKAFFKLEMVTLTRLCHDSALAQVRAVAAARAIEGLSHDGVILNVSKVEIASARSVERTGDQGGSVPVVVVTSLVQHIHAVRNKKVSA